MKKVNFDDDGRTRKSRSLCPSPLNIMVMIQYIKDSMEIFNKLELKLTLFEADPYISYLANKCNA